MTGTRDEHATPAGRALSKIVDVRPQEVSALLWACAYGFCLMGSYFLLRPLRETIGAQPSIRGNLKWLFTGTAVVTLAISPFFSALVSRLSPRRFIPVVYRFLAANVLVFFVLQRTLTGSARMTVDVCFYIWTTVFILFAVSVFWSFLDDVFSSEQGKRLFGFVGTGATLGAMAGSYLTGQNADYKFLDPLWGLPCAAILLEIGVAAFARMHHAGESMGVRAASVERGPDPRLASTGWRGGFTLLARSRYLLGISLWILVFTLSSTFVYMQQARIVSSTADFAKIDFYANLVGLVLQAVATGRLMPAIGVGATAAILPLLTVVGFFGLAAAPVVPMLIAFQVSRRASDFAIAKPAREVLFTVVRPEEKYKAKNFIDTSIYRFGDAVWAWLESSLRSAGLGAWGLAWLFAPLGLGWLALSLALGRRQAELARASAATSSSPAP